MASATIIQALAYINWTVLGSLALGAFLLAWFLRQATDATNGFVGFTAFCSALLGGLLFFADGALPPPVVLAITSDAGLDVPRRFAILVFAALALLAALRMLRGHTARWIGLATLLAGFAALAIAALGWAGDPLHGVPLLVQLLMLSIVSGGSLACVVLAHWYLVTPKISARPLILSTRMLSVAIGLQLVMFFTWQVVGGPNGGPLASFTGPQAFFVWLRLLVGLLFPLVLSYLAYRTALTRSMESATGLLYIVLAAVLASTIVAAALYFSSGLLV